MATKVIEGGIVYCISKDNVTVHKLMDKNLQDIIIPDNIQGRPVTKIGRNAFAKSNIELVQFPSSIDMIGDAAFKDCTKLVEIWQYGRNQNTVIAISREAFKNCNNLEKIVFKREMLILGFEPFSGCKNLKYLPTIISVSVFSPNAFKDCISLEDIEIKGPHEFKVEQNAFLNCNNLKKICLRCKVDLSDYLKSVLKNMEIEAFYKAENILNLAYEGYSVTMLPQMNL